MELNEILQVALRGGASDIHLKAGLPPMFRVDGSLVPLKDARRLPPEEISRMAFGIMNDYQKEKFKAQNELDLAYGVPGLGRFRVNVFQQRGTIGVVLRVIPFKIATIEQLLLPKVLEKIAGEQRGLILVTGTTGSGKSTTLAAMVDHINTNETCHIMTIEDPIEVLVANSRVREMIEDKDRTKEISQAIAQSHTTYGMQTFDQSLMQLFRSNLITYEEALRQSSNPDDFALRVSGISATSDSTWDDFEKKEDAGPQNGKMAARPP